jgi:hypothetical protein
MSRRHWENQPRAPKGTDIGGQWVDAERAARTAARLTKTWEESELIRERRFSQRVPRGHWPEDPGEGKEFGLPPDQWKDKETRIQQGEAQLRDLDHEEAMIFDVETGATLDYVRGEQNTVGLDEIADERAYGNILVHNHHHKNCNTFSPQDLASSAGGPAEIRVVTQKFTDILRSTNRFSSVPNTVEEVTASLDAVTNEVALLAGDPRSKSWQDIGYDMVFDHIGHTAQTLGVDNNELQAIVMNRFAEQYGLEFERRDREDSWSASPLSWQDFDSWHTRPSTYRWPE